MLDRMALWLKRYYNTVLLRYLFYGNGGIFTLWERLFTWKTGISDVFTWKLDFSSSIPTSSKSHKYAIFATFHSLKNHQNHTQNPLKPLKNQPSIELTQKITKITHLNTINQYSHTNINNPKSHKNQPFPTTTQSKNPLFYRILSKSLFAASKNHTHLLCK